MKRVIKVGLGVIIFAFCFLNSASATELGFKAGIVASYSGKFEEVPSEFDRELQFDSSLESIGTPLSIYLLHNHIRFSYLRYEQYAVKELPPNPNLSRGSADGTILISNDVLTIGYQHEFLPLPYDIQFFAGADIAVFKSTLDVDVSAFEGVGQNYYSNSNKSRSEPEISFGLMFTAGVKKYIENVFVAADFTYINKNINFERLPSYEEQIKVDISGFIFSIGTGVAF